ncbi:MAG: hypothetical protein EA358_07315 [Flavobacteriales bacterium]|nr:MAG: hypothetical protein EA358_07315 [Flavobacteriales bacterium]
MKHLYLFCIFILFGNAFLLAQGSEDLLDILGDEPNQNYAEATFKGTRLINMQTNEASAEGVLQFMFQHRFGPFNNDFLYNFFGLDVAQVRLGLDYAISDRLSLGVGRSSYNKTSDFTLKYRLLRQQTGKKNIPLSITLFSAAYLNMTRRSFTPDFSDRLSYSHQLIFARKFSSSFSAMISPSLVHFNLVEFNAQPNSLFVLPVGGRFKLTRRFALTAEYALQSPRNFSVRQGVETPYYNALSVGVDIETGGHVFQLHVTNSRGLIDPDWMVKTTGNWLEGGLFFGFNISRVFTLKEPKRPEVGW